MTLFDANIQKYKFITFYSHTNNNKMVQTKIECKYNTRLIDILKELDIIFGKSYEVYYGIQHVDFNIPLSFYIIENNYFMKINKIYHLTIEYIFCNYNDNIDTNNVCDIICPITKSSIKLNIIPYKMYFTNIKIIHSNNINKLSIGCRCIQSTYTCKCSNTRYKCNCYNNINECCHSQYINFEPIHNCCDIWNLQLNEICDNCIINIITIIYTLYLKIKAKLLHKYKSYTLQNGTELEYHLVISQLDKSHIINILYSDIYDIFIYRFRYLINYFLFKWFIKHDFNDLCFSI